MSDHDDNGRPLDPEPTSDDPTETVEDRNPPAENRSARESTDGTAGEGASAGPEETSEVEPSPAGDATEPASDATAGPAGDTTAEHEPAEHEPAEPEPAEHEPAEHEPAEHEPAEHEPAEREPAARGHRREIPAVLVRHRVPGQTAEYDAGKLALCPRMQVVLDTERGQTGIGTVIREPRFKRADKPLRRVLRVITDEDERVIERNRVREREAHHFCVERIKARELPMKLVSVDLAHSGTRAVFYFSSADRVDFRALVKDLARRFHTRIEMRQIGVRDAARHTGGIGICGRELCCATWLPGFKPISIRMAKDQNLALNHQKLSGLCGRLRCCLQYEQEIYQKQRKGLPKVGKRVITPEGEGRVKDVNVLRQRVRVQLTDGGYAQFDADQIQRPGDVQQQQQRQPREGDRAPRERGRDRGRGAPAGESTTKAQPDAPARSERPTDRGGAEAPGTERRDRARPAEENVRAAADRSEGGKPDGAKPDGARPNGAKPDGDKPRSRRRRRRRGRRGRSRKGGGGDGSGGGGGGGSGGGNKPTGG